MDYTKLIEGVLTIVMVILTGCVIPWIRSKVSAESMRKVLTYVEIAVGAAEQIFDASDGDRKKEWVMNWLSDKGITIDTDTLSAMVEQAVNTLHNELKAE